MPSHAHATLVGHVGGDVTLRDTAKSKVASFSLAVNTGWGDKKTTTWWRVSIWGPPAEWAQRDLSKGSAVMVAGEPAEREYIHNGEERKTLEISCREFVAIGKSEASTADQGADSYGDRASSPADDVPF